MKSDFPTVLTSGEVADILRVSENAILEELEGGRIPGFKVGKEWRIVKDELFRFMEIKMKTEDETCVEENMLDVEWCEAGPFSHTWPEGSVEKYTEAYEADLDLPDCSKVKIGYTTREAAGIDDRYRVIVFMKFGSQFIPVVEFAGANDFSESNRIASVVKNDDNKQVRTMSQLPPEYQGFPIDTYSDVVTGPYASHGLAVVIDKDDRTTMLHHALIRARFKGWM